MTRDLICCYTLPLAVYHERHINHIRLTSKSLSSWLQNTFVPCTLGIDNIIIKSYVIWLNWFWRIYTLNCKLILKLNQSGNITLLSQGEKLVNSSVTAHSCISSEWSEPRANRSCFKWNACDGAWLQQLLYSKANVALSKMSSRDTQNVCIAHLLLCHGCQIGQ